MTETDPVQQSSEQLKNLILQKKRLENEIDIMQKQQQEYLAHKDFYDKLIAFNQRIEQLKDAKEQIIQRNQDLIKINESLKMKIQNVEEAANNRDEQQQLVNELLKDVKLVKAKLGIEDK